MSFVKIALFAAAISHYQGGGEVEVPQVEAPPVQQVGVASWYGDGQWHGDITANGEPFRPNDYTCAHRWLPFNTLVMVENMSNDQRTWCRINDRGPYDVYQDKQGVWQVSTGAPVSKEWRAILDVSSATAESLDMKHAGLQRVRVRYWAPARGRSAVSFMDDSSLP